MCSKAGSRGPRSRGGLWSLLDARSRRRVGGTADAVERWQVDGYEVDIIDVSKL
jgi:hypothetical protein